MATSFSEIYDRFLSLVKLRFICSFTDEELSDYLETFLNGSANVYFKDCRFDLTNYQLNNYYTQAFDGDNIETVFQISQYPTDPDSGAIENICEVDDSSVAFTFNANTLEFTTATPPAIGVGNVVCGYNFVGQYEYDTDISREIDDEELWILAYGMIKVWISHVYRDPIKMKNTLTTKSYHNRFSPAKLLAELQNMDKYSIIEMRRLRVRYSRTDNFDGYKEQS